MEIFCNLRNPRKQHKSQTAAELIFLRFNLIIPFLGLKPTACFLVLRKIMSNLFIFYLATKGP